MAVRAFVLPRREESRLSSEPVAICKTKKVLYSRYLSNLWIYVEAVNDLDGTLSAREFDANYERVTRVRLAFEHSRDELRAHCARHGCERFE